MNLQHRKPKKYYNDDPKKALQFHSEVLMLDENNKQLFNYDETNKSKDLTIKNMAENMVESELIPECISEFVEPTCKAGSLAVDIPVIISQLKLKVDCEGDIELDDLALEVKRTKKDVFLKECKLFPSINKLFIEGFVRNNIEYAPAPEKYENNNNIRHITFNIPFKCSTVVKYLSPPVIARSGDTIEIETINEDLSGNDILEKTFVSSEHINEKISCKLISAEVTELIIGEANNIIDCEHTYERPFKAIIEKLAVTLVIKLIQNQQVMVNLK